MLQKRMPSTTGPVPARTPHMGAATPSGIELPPVIEPETCGTSNPGKVAEYPFTREIFADGFRGRLWTFRQYSGFGSAEESNARYKFLLEQGQTGLSVALDLPTQCGYDPVDPISRPEIGKVGVSLSSLAEMEVLLDGIDLSAISTSFTINGTAAIIYAMYLACADKKGIARDKLTGTIQNDILKEYVCARHLDLSGAPFNAADCRQRSVRQRRNPALQSDLDRRRPCPRCRLHGRGGDGLHLGQRTCLRGRVDRAQRRRHPLRQAAELLLLRAYGPVRGGRQVPCRPAHLGAPDEGALRCHRCQGPAFPLRRGLRRLLAHCGAAVQQHRAGCGGDIGRGHGGAQSIFTCAFDEAFQIPTELSAEIALRTQQIVAYESGVGRTVDPLGGSYAVEYLTDRMEEEILKVMAEIDAYGGVVKAIEEGWIQMRIAERARGRKDKIDSGLSVVVGQNFFRKPADDGTRCEVFRLDPKLSQRVVDQYRAVLARRDTAAAERSLAALGKASAKDRENLLPYLIDCCHAYATVGEMVRELKNAWGEFQEPIRL